MKFHGIISDRRLDDADDVEVETVLGYFQAVPNDILKTLFEYLDIESLC